jgi:hypothetical protein
MSQTKSGFDLNFSMKQNIINGELSKANVESAYRSRTKGRFAASIVLNTTADNFSKDKKWLNKANPVAQKEERKYLDRDKFLLEKRRYQKILKEMTYEASIGISVTKMPDNLKK